MRNYKKYREKASGFVVRGTDCNSYFAFKLTSFYPAFNERKKNNNPNNKTTVPNRVTYVPIEPADYHVNSKGRRI